MNRLRGRYGLLNRTGSATGGVTVPDGQLYADDAFTMPVNADDAKTKPVVTKD